MTEKRMEAIGTLKDNSGITLSTSDVGFGEQKIYIPFEQAQILISWLTEMLEDDEKRTGETDNG